MDKETIERMVEINKALGSYPRMCLLLALINGAHSTNELSSIVKLSQSATSQHLKELRFCRLVKGNKEGMYVFYSLADNHVRELLLTMLEHVKEVNCHEPQSQSS